MISLCNHPIESSPSLARLNRKEVEENSSTSFLFVLPPFTPPLGHLVPDLCTLRLLSYPKAILNTTLSLPNKSITQSAETPRPRL